MSPTSRQPERRSHWPVLRLTRPGWVFLLLAMLVGTAAGKSEVALVFVMFGMMLGTLAVSVLLSWRMVAGVRLRRDCPEWAWQHRPVHLGYYLRSIRAHTSCLGLSVEEIAPPHAPAAGGFCLHLSPRAVFRAAGRFVPRHRGRLRLTASRVSTIFPFGLVRATRTFDAPAELLVWPARGALKRKLLSHGAVETSTAAPSRASGGQDEFFGLREYRSGDNPRWIHWRRSAATRTPVVREMARPLPDVLWVIVDTQTTPGAMGRADRERLLRFAATLIDYALARGYRVGLALADDAGPRILRPAEGRRQRSDLLDALAAADENLRTPLGDTLRRLPRGWLAKSELIVCGKGRHLAAAPLGALRGVARNIQLITQEDLPRVFKDDPLAALEGEDAP